MLKPCYCFLVLQQPNKSLVHPQFYVGYSIAPWLYVESNIFKNNDIRKCQKINQNPEKKPIVFICDLLIFPGYRPTSTTHRLNAGPIGPRRGVHPAAPLWAPRRRNAPGATASTANGTKINQESTWRGQHMISYDIIYDLIMKLDILGLGIIAWQVATQFGSECDSYNMSFVYLFVVKIYPERCPKTQRSNFHPWQIRGCVNQAPMLSWHFSQE